MANFSYEWKVDFAILFSLTSLVITVASSVIQARAKRKAERIRAYEKSMRMRVSSLNILTINAIRLQRIGCTAMMT
jgi:hypothetical protein